jgi:N-acetylglucosamine kinase-like BadF-type ATPase
MDETGTVLGWGNGGATRYSPPEVISASFAEAVHQACGERDLQGVTVVSVGWRDQSVDRIIPSAIRAASVVTTEGRAGFSAALADRGIVVLSGTGSFVCGRLGEERIVNVGGLGPILGDEGSGYDIGLRALRTVLRVPRESGNHTAFRAALLAAAGVANPRELVEQVYGGKMGRPHIAALCRTVVEQAEAGETMALEVLQQAAGALAESVSIVLNELGPNAHGLPVIGIGGVIQGAPLYWRILSEQVRELDPSLTFTIPPVKLVVGAIFEAMAAAGIAVTPELRDRVLETQRAFPGSQIRTNSE